MAAPPQARLVVAESCPLSVRQEALRRGWEVVYLYGEPGETRAGAAAATAEAVSASSGPRARVPQKPQDAGRRGGSCGASDKVVSWSAADGFTLWWRNARFSKSEFANVKKGQRMNHFPHSKTITRKDELIRAIRKMRAVHGKIYGFMPQGFILPTEYTKFVQQYAEDEEKGESSVWICKPSDSSRGRKIFLIRDLSQLHYDQQYVIQRYVPKPLTVGGYKVDLRVYVAVTSMQPLRIHMYRDGLARFGTAKYDEDMQDIDNLYSHLTNSSINKFSDTFNDQKEVIGSGAKWNLAQFGAWLLQDGRGDGAFELLWLRISDIAILTILTLMQAKDCDPKAAFFELFGFDILVDSELRPWLLEANCAPALSIDGPTDQVVKAPLIRDLFDLVQHEKIDRSLRVSKAMLRGRAPLGNHRGKLETRNQDRDTQNKEERTRGDEEEAIGREESFGGFDLVFPFDSVTRDLAETIRLKSGKPNQQEFAGHMREIINHIKLRRKEAVANRASSR